MSKAKLPAPGWIGKMLGPELYKKVLKVVAFNSEEAYTIPFGNRSALGENVGYRSPSPGSTKPADVPHSISDDRLYDIAYFKRDTVRREENKPFLLYSEKLLQADIDIINKVPHQIGSPGNKNPAVLAYDKTGLRSAMSATHAETKASIDKHMPTQLVREAWWDDAEEIMAHHEKNGLPLPTGKGYKWNVPKRARMKLW